MNIKNTYEKLKEKYPELFEIIRFLIIGGIATLIDYFVSGLAIYLFEIKKFNSLFDAMINSRRASLISKCFSTGLGFISGLIFNYIFSIKFVYINKGNSKSYGGFMMFGFLSLIGLIINLIGMLIFTKYLDMNFWIIKIILTLVVLIYNYISKKLIIFKSKTPDASNLENKKDD